MATGSFVFLDDRGVLAVSGPDRRPFLQGLVSNDVDAVSSAQARYAALLTAQGKYLHDFFMVEDGETIWLDAEAARLADLKRRLSIYRLRAKATLDTPADLAVVVAFGDGVLAALGLTEAPGTAAVFAGGRAFVDPRLAALGARIVAPRAMLAPALAASGLAAADVAAYDRSRLALGVPDGSRDLVPDKSILLESGFDELHGVDWHKGCYIGQELTARTKYRGLIKKRLFPVRIEGSVPAAGTPVTLDGRDAGEMRSSRDGTGLALLRLDAVAAGRPLAAGDAALMPAVPVWHLPPTDK